jgi:hypothetical protein
MALAVDWMVPKAESMYDFRVEAWSLLVDMFLMLMRLVLKRFVVSQGVWEDFMYVREALFVGSKKSLIYVTSLDPCSRGIQYLTSMYDVTSIDDLKQLPCL